MPLVHSTSKTNGKNAATNLREYYHCNRSRTCPIPLIAHHALRNPALRKAYGSTLKRDHHPQYLPLFARSILKIVGRRPSVPNPFFLEFYFGPLWQQVARQKGDSGDERGNNSAGYHGGDDERILLLRYDVVRQPEHGGNRTEREARRHQ